MANAWLVLLLVTLPCAYSLTAKSASCTSSVTASSAVAADVAKVTPAVKNCGGIPCADYLTSPSCLGPNGPIGAWGPLGALGPLGTNAWNPSAWMSAVGNWQSWAGQMQANSANPLSNKGPLNPTAYSKTLPAINDFGKQLQAHGLWTVLGPLGPLGALGPLGPLGPMGFHGYSRDKNGNYLDKTNKVARTMSASWDGSSNKTWPLVEMYTSAKAAAAVSNQDTSFIALSSLSMGGSESFTVAASENEFVTVLVVPENVFDSFSVQVDGGGKLLAKSDEVLFVNWVQLLIPKATTLKITVSFNASGRVWLGGFTYRLVVVGSTSMFTTEDIKGPHVLSC